MIRIVYVKFSKGSVKESFKIQVLSNLNNWITLGNCYTLLELVYKYGYACLDEYVWVTIQY